MDEMYILHELHSHEPPQEEHNQESFQNTPSQEIPKVVAETIDEPVSEPIPQCEPIIESTPEPILPPELVFEPMEEPSSNWEMELAQAYVRAQPLEGVFPPEEGLRMGTAFPNLSMPYTRRD